ncbi:MAG: hypothetical protein ACK4TC_00955 [Sphingomonas pseudosanguinis]|uniref:hypothetical protein n=1 Tax=Sphingomonas pseudosanguinis TaxID=413712 RepID=UPI00391995F3
MIDMPDDLDDAFALFEEKSAALDAAVAAVENDQKRGRSGVTAYARAAMLHWELQEFAQALQARIGDELARL